MNTEFTKPYTVHLDEDDIDCIYWLMRNTQRLDARDIIQKSLAAYAGQVWRGQRGLELGAAA